MATCRQIGCGIFALLAFQLAMAAADDRTAAHLLPETTIVYAEVQQPAAVIQRILELQVERSDRDVLENARRKITALEKGERPPVAEVGQKDAA